MKALFSDFRFGFRSARKDLRFTAMVVLTLTICVAANTALFSIVNSVLLEPLPVPDADSIILMSNRYPKAGIAEADFSGASDYYDRQRAVTVLEDQAMFKETAHTLDENGTPERIEQAKILASRDGYHSFRVAVIDLSTPPDFAKTINRGRTKKSA